MRTLTVALLSVFAAATAAAQTMAFPPDNFGRANKTYNESSASQAREEVIVGTNDFEEIWELNSDDKFRLLGRSVGLLDLLIEDADGERLNSTCTATRIDADKILTNYHCVPGRQFKVIDARVRFGFLHRISALGEAFRVSTSPLEASSNLDYAILTLEERPSLDKYPPINTTVRNPENRESLFLIHHPAGMPQQLTRFQCQALDPAINADGKLNHVCDTLGGSSGSAIFALNDNALTGLHHSGLDDGGTQLNFGTPSASLSTDSSTIGTLVANRPVPPAGVRAVVNTAVRPQGGSFVGVCENERDVCREIIREDYRDCRALAEGSGCARSCIAARTEAFQTCSDSHSSCLQDGKFVVADFILPACVGEADRPVAATESSSTSPTVEFGTIKIHHNVPIATPAGPYPGIGILLEGGELQGVQGRQIAIGARFLNPDGTPLKANVAETMYRDLEGDVVTGFGFVGVDDTVSLNNATLYIPYAALNFAPTNYAITQNVLVQVEVMIDGQVTGTAPREAFSFPW